MHRPAAGSYRRKYLPITEGEGYHNLHTFVIKMCHLYDRHINTTFKNCTTHNLRSIIEISYRKPGIFVLYWSYRSSRRDPYDHQAAALLYRGGGGEKLYPRGPKLFYCPDGHEPADLLHGEGAGLSAVSPDQSFRGTDGGRPSAVRPGPSPGPGTGGRLAGGLGRGRGGKSAVSDRPVGSGGEPVPGAGPPGHGLGSGR